MTLAERAYLPTLVEVIPQPPPDEIEQYQLRMAWQTTLKVLRFVAKTTATQASEVRDLEWLFKRAVRILGLIKVYQQSRVRNPLELDALWQEILSLSTDLSVVCQEMRARAATKEKKRLLDSDFQMNEELKFYSKYQLQSLNMS